MKKEPTKGEEAELLNLLKQVLPKATTDAKLAGEIYSAIESQLKIKARATAFDKFCSKVALPNLDKATVADVAQQFAASFGDGDVTINANKEDQLLSVEVALMDGSQFAAEIKVNPDAVTSDEQDVKLKFVPFPVCLPGDVELIWAMARREDFSADEAARSLEKIEVEFWESKSGQNLQRKGVEKCFPEFIARVPAAMLGESGLKRHYKEPEPLKPLHSNGQTR